MTSKRVLAAVFVVCLATAPALFAQGSGSIEGAVSRGDGTGVGGVAVVLNELGRAELTGSGGGFAFRGVPAGTYSLSFTLGNNVADEADVEVTAGSTTTVEKSVDWQVAFAETITVVSASRRAERIVEAPAAITVVTEEEIEREASHGQLPKLLEFTPGAEVTQSGVYDYNFNTRGFNSSLTRRVATLVDGRDPSVPFLGAQEWAAVSFPLDDLASLELLRGPSAALYGANASSGVLNMITKAPRYSQGGQIRLTGGELSTTNADLRWAGTFGGEAYFKVVGGIRNSGDFTVSRVGVVEYPGLPFEGAPLNPVDDNEITFFGVRFDKYFGNKSFTLETGDASIEGPAFQTGIGRVQLVDVKRPWYRANFNTNHFNFLVYNTQRDASRQRALASGFNLALDTERTQFEVQTNWSFADDKGRIVLGGSHAEEEIDSFDPLTGRQSLVFRPISADKDAFFGQVDYAFSPKVKIVLAGRLDESDLHSSQFSPKASLVYSVNSENTLRFSYNEAFQVPNYSEFFLQANVAAPVTALAGLEALFCAPFGVSCGLQAIPVLAVGNATLSIEEVQSMEVGYSGILGGKAFLTIDYYRSDNENFITDLISQFNPTLGIINPNFGPYQPPAGLPGPVAAQLQAFVLGAVPIMSNNLDGSPIIPAVSYANFGKVDTQGVDVGLNHYFKEGWTFSFTYSWFDFDVKEALPGLEQLLLPNSPEGKGSVGLSRVTEKWDGDISMRWVDSFDWATGPFVGRVPSYTTVDVTANYSINDRVGIGINVANLLDDEHFESFGGDLLGRRALGNIVFSW